jgi:hypothetical protein
MVGSISLASEVSLLLLVPTFPATIQIKCAKEIVRYQAIRLCKCGSKNRSHIHTASTAATELNPMPNQDSTNNLPDFQCCWKVRKKLDTTDQTLSADEHLGDHPKAAIDYHFKTGHTETA